MENSPRENTCVVCFRNITIYAVGDCDHYDRICYICSTRLRVLCNKYECPICRKDIPKVIFSRFKQPYAALSRICYPVDHKYKIAFTDQDVRDSYEDLLEHACPECAPKHTFQSFGQLKDHIRKEHHLFFCELCVENLKLFTHERRCYNRKNLGIHRRLGDADDTSHKGHPACQFCEERYMDNDELFRHLRKDHFFCHFCDNEGKYFFYRDYKYLEDHFRDEHFLCEEGSCKEEKFTGAFKTQIDLKAHKATQHSKTMNKQQAKQARTLELEFTYRSRANQPQSDPFEASGRKSRKTRTRDPRNYRERDNEEEPNDGDFPQQFVAAPDTHCQKEFPQLGGDCVDSSGPDSRVSLHVAPIKSFGRRFNAQSEEDFPMLSGAAPSTSASGVTATRLTLSSPQISRTSNSLMLKINNKDKGGGTGNISIQVSSKPKPLLTTDDFPSLTTQATKLTVKANSTGSGAPSSKSDASKTKPSNPSSNKSTQETNGWKASKPSNKPIFDEEFPSLLSQKSADTQEKCVSSLTIPVGGTSWTKNSHQKDNTTPKEELSFTVVKGKNKKSERNCQKQESNWKSKESADSNKRDNTKSAEKTELVSSKTATLQVTEASNGKGGTVPGDNNKEHSETKDVKVASNTRVEINEDDFPPLVSGKQKTPPGFSARPSANLNSPPPGFQPSAPSLLNVNNNMTALTLSAVARQLVCPEPTLDPDNVSPVPKIVRALYVKPVDFEDRNRALILKIRDLLDGDDSAFDNFKTLSGHFRKNLVQAKEYYDTCLSIFGKDKFFMVFSELLVLLPDIGKEQELLNVYNQVLKKENQNHGAVPKSSVLNSQNALQVLVCATCQQVLAAKDFQKHMFYHNDDTLFPPLGGCNHSDTTHITWVKK